MKPDRWTLATTLRGMLVLLTAPAQAVVLTADVLHGAASRQETGQGVGQDPLHAAHQLGLLHAGGNIGDGAHLPPYYKLAFIMKR